MGTVAVIHGDQIDPMVEQITSVNDVFNAVHSQDSVLFWQKFPCRIEAEKSADKKEKSAWPTTLLSRA